MHQEVILNIRKYQSKDKSSLVSLWESVFPDDPPHNAPSIVIEQKLVVDDLIFVAENDKKIVGACIAGYDGHRGWLYAVAVTQSHRRKGTGTLLIKFTIKALKAIGCNKVNLQIRSTNTAVADFYKSLGFFTEDRLSMGVFT
ncbi:MAG: GNAT family acetyltransferase [Desulfobacteraceae bacterium]|nr:GNAT family acetyltransferase [Desulfobacteraceae bacterium]